MLTSLEARNEQKKEMTQQAQNMSLLSQVEILYNCKQTATAIQLTTAKLPAKDWVNGQQQPSLQVVVNGCGLLLMESLASVLISFMPHKILLSILPLHPNLLRNTLSTALQPYSMHLLSKQNLLLSCTT